MIVTKSNFVLFVITTMTTLKSMTKFKHWFICYHYYDDSDMYDSSALLCLQCIIVTRCWWCG